MKISIALLSLLILVSVFVTGVASIPEKGARLRHLKSSKSAKTPKSQKTAKSPKESTKPSASRVVTMWWIIFNKPSACSGSMRDGLKCGLPDVMGAAMAGSNDAMISIFHGTGGVADASGSLRLTSTLYKTKCSLDLTSDSDGHYLWGGPPPLYSNAGFSYGLCPATGEEAEVHIVYHDHGAPASGEDLIKQLTRFNDPLCIQFDGPQTCVDVGFSAFEIMNSDGQLMDDVYSFPMFPDGCVESGECTAEQKAVQLSSDIGNQVYLIRSGGGDSYQVVANLHLPMA